MERNGSSAAEHDDKGSCLVSRHVSNVAFYELVVMVTDRAIV